jgi:O-antigen/teichoic acid export membrane protein
MFPLRSPAVVSAILFAAGGVGFAVGNILLARVLSPQDFGVVSLFLALTQLGITLGPVGLESVINRHQLGANRALLARAALTASAVAIVLAAVAYAFYGMSAAVTVVLGVTLLTAALNRVAGAFFQSRKRLGYSLTIILVHNWVVLLAVPVVLLFEHPAALPAALTVASAYALTAAVGWWHALQRLADPETKASSRTLMREGLAAVGVQAALGVMFQLDRLLIPRALTIADLALYAVVSAIAASPFRMLQVGTSFTLLPRFRASPTRAAILQLLRLEAAVVLPIAVVASIGVLIVTPWIGEHVLEGRYVFAPSLLYAMIVVGFVRVWNGFASAAVTALGTTRQLAVYNVWGWIALAVATAAAFAASRAGLTGIVYGLGAGWLTLALAATVISVRAIGAWRPPSAPR